jgi:hypothetical protein
MFSNELMATAGDRMFWPLPSIVPTLWLSRTSLFLSEVENGLVGTPGISLRGSFRLIIGNIDIERSC